MPGVSWFLAHWLENHGTQPLDGRWCGEESALRQWVVSSVHRLPNRGGPTGGPGGGSEQESVFRWRAPPGWPTEQTRAVEATEYPPARHKSVSAACSDVLNQSEALSACDVDLGRQSHTGRTNG